MNSYHDDPLSGHQGISVTYDRLRKNFYWDGMYTDCVRHIRSCDKCLRNKRGAAPTAGPLSLLSMCSYCFERVGTDVCGPYPESEDENTHVIAFVDYLSRWAITVPCKNPTAETIAQAYIEKVVCQFGPATTLLSDRGSNFLSDIVTEICKFMQTQRVSTTAYHPQTNGKTERFWGALNSMLKMFVDEDSTNWDLMLPFVTFAYNTGVRSGTGFSPYEVLFGHAPRLPIDNILVPPRRDLKSLPVYVRDTAERIKKVQKLAAEISTIQQEKMKVRYDRKTRQKRFQVGDLVLLKIERLGPGQSKKLSSYWEGPHRIVYCPLDAPTAVIRFFDDPDGKYDKVSTMRLKKYESQTASVCFPACNYMNFFEF